MIVVDASVVAPALAFETPHGVVARRYLHGHGLAAPGHLYLEVLSAWRGLVRAGKLSPGAAATAVERLRELPVDVAESAPLLPRVWELRDNMSPYDAAYVALAELRGVPLVTGDARLARSAGARCRVEVLGGVP